MTVSESGFTIFAPIKSDATDRHVIKIPSDAEGEIHDVNRSMSIENKNAKEFMLKRFNIK